VTWVFRTSGATLRAVRAVGTSETRLRALFEAGMAITSELSLDALLQRLVETAAGITGARYAALGVIDRSGSQLERFLTTGVDAETHAAIGDLPRGRGILGLLIREAKPLRLHDLSEDPHSVGFPPGHPPMRSFLGVPILLRSVAYGNFYLCEKADGEDFTEEDQDLVTLLAGQAAVAIENARLYEATTQWSTQLESLHDVGNALATETDLDRLLDIVARRLRDLLEARLVAVLLPVGTEDLRFAAVARGDGVDDDLLGRTMPRATSKSGRVFERGRSERSDSVLDDPEVDHEIIRRFGARSGLWVPLVARSHTIGLIAAHDKLGADARFSDNDLRLAETFASRAALAVDLSQRIARDALRRVVDAQELERRRLARELHDETGQALTSILLGLRTLEETLDGPGPQAAVADLRELVVATLQDVRRLAVELRPKVLDDFGLVPALERLTETFAEQTGIVVRFESGLGAERLPAEVETALYRIVQESLTNIVKHAHARTISIALTRKPGTVAVVVEDDGQGFDPAGVGEGGFGLEGMRERVGLLDGRLQVESSEGAGTTLVAEVPASQAPERG
jgi:two-component system, NarL family, sensor histidine kinase DevS